MAPNPSSVQKVPAPWGDFLSEVDQLISHSIELHCLGGFVMTASYGLPRPTADVDYLSVRPPSEQKRLEEIAGRESALAKKYKVYFQHVSVTNYPEDYESRLVEILPGEFQHLHIFALDPYDLALTKLERNSPKDREDVEYLAKHVPLEGEVLRNRYQKELRPYLATPQWHDQSLQLWLDSFFPPK